MAAKSRCYVHDTCLIHIEKIVSCWTGCFPHFGTTSTSRGEGNHFIVKMILGIVNNDLLTVFNYIRLLLDMKFTELNAKIESDKSTLSRRHAVEFMKPLVKKVSKHALDKLMGQYNNSIDMDDGGEFTGLFRASFGVPCRHEIKRHINENGRFHIGGIHRQWHLVAPSVVQPAAVSAEPCSSPRKILMRTLEQRLYEAEDDHVTVVMARLDEASQASLQSLSNSVVVTRKRGRPTGPTNNKANQREKSLFEYTTGRKCSRCGQPGHNARTCNVKES
ncbi:hypothetical protein PsorP6_010322 [Peronosclerospora sorghi]|uniref:Uncharacterized protein n=1 Tax=Peronosclerospora sorghi TaxID=230839 RepID=A0ACC0VYC1_9STRA|nr:hypothetical protein PsorP6_010322 [Peronosclerospora sorghi]